MQRVSQKDSQPCRSGIVGEPWHQKLRPTSTRKRHLRSRSTKKPPEYGRRFSLTNLSGYRTEAPRPITSQGCFSGHALLVAVSARIEARERRKQNANPQGWDHWTGKKSIHDRRRHSLRSPLILAALISKHLDPDNSSAYGTVVSAEHGRVDISSLQFPSPRSA
jgi:hypothetical protein